ncbi:MAG: hypothetical protein Q8R47_04210 [Nanoarchaeota archaeon]|nr:hypothetical protein [Nanoarchaeota archaeon]
MVSTDIQFLVPFLYDGENMVQRSPGSGVSDLTRKVHHVFEIMREDPTQLRARDVSAVVYDANSQLAKKDERMAHFLRVGNLTSQLVAAISERNPDLELPSPKVGYAMGLVHDLSNAFAKYGVEFDQEEKELSFYHLAIELDAQILADAAQHNAYLEIANMIAKRTGFNNVGHYSAWSEAYNYPNNPHSILAMFEEYGNPCAASGNDFAHGKDKLALMALTVADCIDDGKSYLLELDDREKLKANFDLRMSDVVARSYGNKIKAGKAPTAFGVALVEKSGLQRMESYLNIVNNLLSSSL